MEDNKLKIFIGSSSEAANNSDLNKKYSLKIASILRNTGVVEPVMWNKSPSIFKVGKSTLENLEELVLRENIVAAVFIYSEDDKNWSRGELHNVTRDNVVFEHGLFSGILGRTKAITVKIGNIKMPSDLYGIICIDYGKNPEDAELNICQWVTDLKTELNITYNKQNSEKSDIVLNNSNNLDTTIINKENTKKSELIELIPIQQGIYNNR